ncbi:PIN domain-containing protein [Halovenus marina]|uniref:PIN domain-containing protein n=1 Tax=Halovenus marina TaxID=3396621 RepID=UPI003F5536D2
MILDTSYVIALNQQDSNAIELSREHDAANLPQRLPATVLSELYVSAGAGQLAHENVRAYEELVGNLPIIDIDANIARRAGAIQGDYLASETKPDLGLADATIAATALVYNEPVVTDDTDDFGSVEGLDVVSWN